MGSSKMLKKFPPPLPNGAPWFVFGEDGQGKTQTFCTIWPQNKSDYHVKAIPELHGKMVRASYYGWLLLQDDVHCMVTFSLWNPITLATISLPPLTNLHDLDDNTWITCCALTSSPDKDDNFGVFVFCEHLVFWCHPRRDGVESGWRTDEILVDGKQASVHEAVGCGGVVYAVAITIPSPRGCYLTTVKADDVRRDSLVVDMPDTRSMRSGYRWYLLESCGQVYHVRVLSGMWHQLDAVEVWELDLENEGWVQVKSLNDRAFFLGKDCCTWCWATPQVEPNSVFYSVCCCDDGHNTLYQYNLQDGCHTLLYSPCPTLQTDCIDPFWFTPQQPSAWERSLRKLSIKEVDSSLNQNAAEIAQLKELSNQNEATGNMLDDLPLDLIHPISEYLDWFDYTSLRSTCKSHRAALPLSWCHWGRANPSWQPLLVYVKNNGELFQVMDPTQDKSCSIINPRLPKTGFFIRHCKDGWIILHSDEETYEYFNLFTKVRGEFPRIGENTDCFESVGFSTSPDSSDCATVGIFTCRQEVHICYIQLRKQTWEHAKFDEGNTKFRPSSCHSVYHNGGFYFFDWQGHLGVFKLVGHEPTWHVYGRPQTKEMEFHSLHLLECDGQLFSVFIGRLGNWIQVFRFDEVNESWVVVESLGKHVFFISGSSSISTIATDGMMSNRIYLPRLVDNRFMFYSLETRKYHVQGTEQQLSMENFCMSKAPVECCWA